MKSLAQLFQLYSCSWNAIVVVAVELEIFKSSDINIRLLKHLEVSCIEKSPVNNTMRYLSRISTALKGLVPCYPLALNACKQSI